MREETEDQRDQQPAQDHGANRPKRLAVCAFNPEAKLPSTLVVF